MTKTDVSYIDSALAALNIARFALSDDRCPIYLIGDCDGVEVEPVLGETNTELDALIEVTQEAAQTVTAWLAANPGMMIVDDHLGRWVAIRTA